MSVASKPDDGDAGGDLDAELAATEALFGAELRALLRPIDGLSDRTRLEVGDALLARSSLALGIDLLGVGWQTVRLLFGPSGTSYPSPTHRHLESEVDR